MIRRPCPTEIKLLPQIENEADRRYTRVGLRQIVCMPPAALAAKRGFKEVPLGGWPHPFRLQFMTENGHGHPPWRRSIMRRGV
jgi:hypothetical protein